jgi:hypothetical protein
MLAALEAGIVELPAFPRVVIQVQEVLRNPNYSVQMSCSRTDGSQGPETVTM